MEPYKKHFAQDKKAALLFKHDIILPVATKSIVMSLVGSILGQQLSVAVARVMRERFLALYDGKNPSAKMILETPIEKIRAIGISQSKANYIHNVASFLAQHKITLKKLEKMSDEDIISLLTQIKGVGRWTVEMILIFGLRREDVFALDDLGIQKAMIHLFKLQDLSKKDLRTKMLKLSKRWSPYRSYISLHMWKMSNNLPG